MRGVLFMESAPTSNGQSSQSGDKFVSIRMPVAEYEQLEKLAESEMRRVSNMARILILNGLNAMGARPR